MERNVKSIVNLLADMVSSGAQELRVKPERHREYNDWLEGKFSQFSWGVPSCSSYYVSDTGFYPFLFPGKFKEYADIHEEIGLADFDLVATS